MPDIYKWRACYRDGTWLDEYNADGRGVGFASIDHDRLVRFELIPTTHAVPPFHVDIHDGMRLIFFRRRSTMLSLDEGVPLGPPQTTTVVGWQSTVKGVNVKTFLFIRPNGSMMLGNRDPGGE